MSKDFFVEKIAVASIDMLGISNCLKDTGTEHAFNKLAALHASLKAVKINRVAQYDPIKEELCNTSLPNDFISYFSDSIYFFGNQNDPIHKQVEVLALHAMRMINNGFLAKPNYFIRAGIAVGNLKYRLESDGQVKLATGSSLLLAHELENAQKWIGVSTYKELINWKDNRYDMWVDGYSVPLKSQFKSEGTPIAVNWVKQQPIPSIDKNTLIGILEEEKSKAKDLEVIEKYENTKQFVSHQYH